MKLVLVGNPENRRVALYQDALAKQGLPAALVVPWIDVAHDRLPELPAGAVVRIDSAGESWEVEKAMLALGWEDARGAGCARIDPAALANLPEDRGRILYPRQYHFGFLAALARLDALFANRPDLLVLNEPKAIADLFDKRVTSRKYESLGLPVPRRLDVSSADELRASGAESAFVKLSCGSSASCLVLWTREPESLLTSIEIARTGWYNNLKVRTYTARRDVGEILRFLFAEGSIVEEAVPKARIDGRWFDLRVLVVAGEPAFVVARTSAIPITNLHLGGTRGDVDRVRALAGGEWERAMETCRAVARAHASLQVGVDLLFEEGFRAHRIVEANAFGDLLPNLEREGLDVYGWQIRKAREAWTARAPGARDRRSRGG